MRAGWLYLKGEAPHSSGGRTEHGKPPPMQIKTATSMSGFIASTPQISRMDNGEIRCYIKAGQEHYTRHEDGTFTQEAATFHDLILFRKPAERAIEMFRKGDRFIAEGYLHTYQATSHDGLAEEREEFVARKIGHDSVYTAYQVDRSPKIQQGPTNICPATQPAQQTAGPAPIGM